MIEFKGTSEAEWITMQGHRVKAILKDLEKYRSVHKNKKCPFVG